MVRVLLSPAIGVGVEFVITERVYRHRRRRGEAFGFYGTYVHCDDGMRYSQSFQTFFQVLVGTRQCMRYRRLVA